MKVFINGVDSNVTVATYTPLATTFVTSAAVAIPSGAAVTFYAADNSFTLGAAPTSFVGPLTLPAPTAPSAYANVNIGDKLFIDNVDMGVTVTAKTVINGANTVTLSGPITSGSTAAVFKHPLAMTLVTPEGSEIPVTGASNRKDSKEQLTTTTSQVEVYAAVDGNFIGLNSTTNSNRLADPEVTGGYKTVAKLSFAGGENIDTIVKDSMNGNPIFKTNTKLTTRLTNQAGGSTDLIFDLNLSGSQLHAGAFQITKSIQNGEAMSRLSSVTVDNTGRIVGIYGTGKQQLIGQVAMVSFDNEEGLIPVGKNAFAPSTTSGIEQDGTGVTVGRAGTGLLGEIRSQALESSNVDLANELVRLMILQRSYTANSQSLKAIDQTLRDTLQMVG
jgi:flagellar hook-basal body protein